VETSAARRANRSTVLAAILATGSSTRTGLADSTGLSPATVSRVADGLIAEGLITEGSSVASGRRGRNAISLEVTADLGLVCGVDLGGANCRFVLADLLGQPIRTSHERTPVDLGAAALADWMARRVDALTVASGAPLKAVSVGLPGMAPPDGAAVSGAPNLPQIEGEVFARRLTQAIPAPVNLHNDSDLALLGELRFGAGRGLATAVMFTIGAGLGAGVALDGRLLRGRHGLVGEFGYLPAGPSGELVEELLSGTGLLRRARTLGVRVGDVAEIFAPGAPALLGPLREQFDRALLLILAAATAAYEPEAVLIGGGLSPVVAERLGSTERRLRELMPRAPELRLAELGDLSGALGALAAACLTAYQGLGISDDDAASLPSAAALGRLHRKEAVDVRRAPGQ
jgi:predicted NBD/HSP70 family sugar kinase